MVTMVSKTTLHLEIRDMETPAGYRAVYVQWTACVLPDMGRGCHSVKGKWRLKVLCPDQRIRLVLDKLFGGKYVRGSGLLIMR